MAPRGAEPAQSADRLNTLDKGDVRKMEPPGAEHVPVPVPPRAGATSIVDNWLREGKAEIGMGSTAVYDAYMQNNRPGLVHMAQILSPSTAPPAMSLIEQGDTEGYVNLLVPPALDALGDLHPNATFELLTVEPDVLGTAMPQGFGIYTPQTVIRMAENGQSQDYVVDASQLFQPTADDRVHDALAATPGGLGLAAWNEAIPEQWCQGDTEATWDALNGLPSVSADYAITLGVMTMDPAAQAEFLKAYAQSSDLALGVLRPIDTVPDASTVLSVDATAIARGQDEATLATTLHVTAVDGLADSAALPPIGGLSDAEWRATLDQLALDPPADITELRVDLERLSGGTLGAAALDEAALADANVLPAVLSLVQDHPPEVSFDDTLHLSIVPGGRGVPPTYESISYDPLANVVVVETSLNQLLRDADEQDRLAETYAAADMPMTVRVPLPEGAPTDWSHPSVEQFALLNQQIQTIGSTSVFLHGYQSDRRVWQSDMQRWMELSPEPTIGIAIAGMGSEGDFLGSGASPLTAKQYAFDTMEALDALGLYSKELTLYGHSMGGAAVLQMGLATDRMVDTGATRPDVNYVLLQPAPTGDSVPFLAEGSSAFWIGVQNWSGISIGLVAENVVNDLMPGAPDYIKEVHSSFAGTGGIPQLRATGSGLLLQAEPDPAAVQAFLANNHVLVVAGTQDRIVSTQALLGLFDGQVYEVPGNHYAHLPSDIAEQNRSEDVEQRVRDFLLDEVQPARRDE